MSTAEILELFHHVPDNSDFAPFEKAIRAAVEQQEQITPELIALIDRAVADPAQFEGPDDGRLSVAICLLAQFREQRACDSILRFFSLPGEKTFELTGDLFECRGAAVLAAVCGGRHKPLLRLVLNEDLSQYVRVEALDGLLVQEIWSERSRADVVDDLRKLFQTLDRPGNDYVWAHLIGAVCDCPAPELTPEVREAFAEKLPDATAVGDLKSTLHKLASTDLSRLDDFRMSHRPIDAVEECSVWGCFDEEPEESLLPFEEPFEEPFVDFLLLTPRFATPAEPGPAIATGEQPYHAPPKPGRNDPCPCGSGRKYKKCCALLQSPRVEPAPGPIQETSMAPNRLAGMIPFHLQVPDPGLSEIRSIELHPSGGSSLSGEFAFFELYCADTECDCRRVVISVVNRESPRSPAATINFGWESLSFYAAKFDDDAHVAREITEARLDPLNTQSRYAEELLKLFRTVFAPDPEYVARLKRHYKLFKGSLRDTSTVSNRTGRQDRVPAVPVE